MHTLIFFVRLGITKAKHCAMHFLISEVVVGTIIAPRGITKQEIQQRAMNFAFFSFFKFASSCPSSRTAKTIEMIPFLKWFHCLVLTFFLTNVSANRSVMSDIAKSAGASSLNPSTI
jgi:hypothetical protein